MHFNMPANKRALSLICPFLLFVGLSKSFTIQLLPTKQGSERCCDALSRKQNSNSHSFVASAVALPLAAAAAETPDSSTNEEDEDEDLTMSDKESFNVKQLQDELGKRMEQNLKCGISTRTKAFSYLPKMKSIFHKCPCRGSYRLARNEPSLPRLKKRAKVCSTSFP